MARILVVDNEAQYLSSVTGSLRRAGIDVQEASCIFSALEQIGSDRPDIVVSAEHFAGLDVLDLLELKRAEPKLADIGMVVVSPSRTRKLECFKLGCDDFITLPAEDAELFFRICALLRRLGNKGVRGKFADISILDLVQMLIASRRDGRLSTDFSNGSGALYFKDGQVYHAELGREVGEEAFLAILRASQKGGSFAFSVDDTLPAEKTIDKRTDHLLLGLANILDERG